MLSLFCLFLLSPFMHQLGSDDFDVRRAACKQLTSTSFGKLVAFAGLAHPDPEISTNCQISLREAGCDWLCRLDRRSQPYVLAILGSKEAPHAVIGHTDNDLDEAINIFAVAIECGVIHKLEADWFTDHERVGLLYLIWSRGREIEKGTFKSVTGLCLIQLKEDQALMRQFGLMKPDLMWQLRK